MTVNAEARARNRSLRHRANEYRRVARIVRADPPPSFDGDSESNDRFKRRGLSRHGGQLDDALGAAAVHDRQALVLVNRGGATGADVLALARAIQADVRAQFGVELEAEPVCL